MHSKKQLQTKRRKKLNEKLKPNKKLALRLNDDHKG